MKPVRVRFAPSPTGFLHVGGARTLLFNWLYAKRHGGTLVLRIEDTDQARSTRESERMILEDIRKLSLKYSEGVEVGGPYGPYRQSERLAIYSQYAQQLLDADRVYYCFCSDELLTQKREAAFKLGKVPHYDGTCSRISRADAEAKLKAGEKAGLRFRVPMKAYVVQDHVRGRVEFKEGMVGDFLITRTPQGQEGQWVGKFGFPVYNFCCVVDDALMQISHVIRAEEHLSNTVRQLILYEAFGWTAPEYVHIALVLGADQQKLSKRTGDVSVCDYLEKGYLPEALLNFLALLGWWPPAGFKPISGHPEIFSIDEMIEVFDFHGLQKAPGVFDPQKLRWMNSYYIHHLPLADLVKKVRPFFETAGHSFANRSEVAFEGIVAAVRSEVKLLSEFPAAALALLEGIPDLEPDAASLLADSASAPIVEALKRELKGMPQEFTAEDVSNLLQRVAAAAGVQGKKLFMPIRAVLTGKTHGPELKQILPLLGRDMALKRLEALKNKGESCL